MNRIIWSHVSLSWRLPVWANYYVWICCSKFQVPQDSISLIFHQTREEKWVSTRAAKGLLLLPLRKPTLSLPLCPCPSMIILQQNSNCGISFWFATVRMPHTQNKNIWSGDDIDTILNFDINIPHLYTPKIGRIAGGLQLIYFAHSNVLCHQIHRYKQLYPS